MPTHESAGIHVDDSRRHEDREEHLRNGSATDAQQNGPDTAGEDVDKLKAERDSLLDRLARLQAEFENSRKRAAAEMQQYKDFALAESMKSLLPALDSFDWALQAPVGNLDEFRGGVDLIRKQLHDALGKLGLTTIQSKGARFDPRLHEAVDTVERAPEEENRVVDELQRGYMLRDRLLRPAMVLVGRKADQ